MTSPVWVAVTVQVMREGRLGPKVSRHPFALMPEFGGSNLLPEVAAARVSDILGVEFLPVGSVVTIDLKVESGLGLMHKQFTLRPAPHGITVRAGGPDG